MSAGADIARVVSTLRADVLAGDRSIFNCIAMIREVIEDPDPRRTIKVISGLAGLYTAVVLTYAEDRGVDPDELLNSFLCEVVDFGDGPSPGRQP